MTTVHLYPVGEEVSGMIGLHHDFDGPLKDAEVSLSQPYDDDPQNADVITFHPDRIPALMNELAELLMQWKRANSPLYREPSTAGEW